MRSNDNVRDRCNGLPTRKSGWFVLVILALSSASLLGCGATVTAIPTGTVGGYAVVPVDGVPVALDTYARFYFGDRYAYLVDGRWYYPTAQGWVMFLDEPEELSQYRARVQTAPPAKRAPDVYYGYPPPSQPRELHREQRRQQR